MGLGSDTVVVRDCNVGRSSGKKKKNSQAREPVCWFKFRFLRGCFSGRSKRDNPLSGTSIQYESRSTNDTSRDHPFVPVVSSSTTSNTISTPSTPKIIEELKVAPQLRSFSFNELKLATRSFRPDTFLGQGGFGSVFKGWINENGTSLGRPGTGFPVAVKMLNHGGRQGHKEWLAEVHYLGNLLHTNLVKLIGFCNEDEQRLLVYEFMPRGSLENHLFRRSMPLSWSIRMKVALGAAKGLAFLHEEAETPVIYRDFKASNILLDADYNAKLSDFGLAKDGPEGDKTHVSTRVMGTYGYAAPEYVMTGHLTAKSDVYSFGVVLLELLTGRRCIDRNRPRGEQILVDWAKQYFGDRRRCYWLLDPRLEGHFSMNGAHKAIQLAELCLRRDPKARPLMSEVVEVIRPLPLLKDMACSSPQFQAMQAEHMRSTSNAGNVCRAQLTRFSLGNGQPIRNGSILNAPPSSPNHPNHRPQRFPKLIVGPSRGASVPKAPPSPKYPNNFRRSSKLIVGPSH